MLESLTDRMSQALKNLRGLGKLTEENIAEALQEVRAALLSADVHFKVVRNFIDKVKEECIGQEVTKSVSPGQQIIKIISDELTVLLGEGATELSDKKPLKILMVGLHGAGKTTTSAKLAYNLKKKGYSPALVACDVYRPAAIDQLEHLGGQEKFPVYANRNTQDVPQIGKDALTWAKDHNADAIIFDTAGRLQIDEPLIEEIKRLKNIVQPDEVLLVADSALGQEAVNISKHFHEAVNLTGIILTKLDGDARGGAALSMKSITGIPIKFIGNGEKIDNLDRFHPERMAQRILGMGDVVSLVEKAQALVDEKEAQRMAEKFKRAEFDFEDFLSQLRQVKKLGSVGSLTKMLPGMNNFKMGDEQDRMLKKTEALILSMTPKERAQPGILNGSRRLRIANGAGLQVKDLNQLLKQFLQMKKLMKSMKGAKGKKLQQKLAGMKDMKELQGLGSKLPF